LNIGAKQLASKGMRCLIGDFIWVGQTEEEDSMPTLPWNFEAFRRYLPFSKMQQAASVLSLHEKERLDSSNPAMDLLLSDLQQRTGEPWLPDRKVSDSVDFNVEGDFYRNKGRLLTSFYIIQPKQLVKEPEPVIMMTEFGRALANGFVSEKEYYNFIVTKFGYPHPAYDDNWKAWKEAGRSLKPLIFILQILVALYENGRDHGFVTSEEIATSAYPLSEHAKANKAANDILKSRDAKSTQRQRSDEVDRKINDMFGFLCMSGYTFYDGQSVRLNLLGVHPDELAYYWEKRKGTRESNEADKLSEVEKLIEQAEV
jgi:hypothetical protein